MQNDFKADLFYLKCINTFIDGLILELSLHPKPGLVTPLTPNVHKDMDFFTMFHSLHIIRDYLTGLLDICKSVFLDKEEKPSNENTKENHDPYLYYFSQLQNETTRFVHWGVINEKRMLAQSNGVNTYKGILYTFGVLFVSYFVFSDLYGKIESDEYEPIYNITKYSHIKSYQHVLANVGKIITTIKRNSNQVSKESFSMQIFEKYKVKGIFEEAADGYPVIFSTINHYLGLKAKYSFKTIVDDHLSYDFKRAILLNLFSFCSMNITDSNIIRKAGYEIFKEYNRKIARIALGKIDTDILDEIDIVNEYCLQNGISPGGSADLFASILVVLKLFEQL